MIWSVILNFLSEFWVPIAAALGGIAAYLKGRMDSKKANQLKETKEELERVKRLNDVEVNTDRASALERLRKSGDVRED